MFNDDIQGTGSVILGGFVNAARLSAEASGRDLKDQRIVFMGAGSAGVGVAKQLLSFFKNLGMPEEEAKERVWLVDTKGLVTEDRGDKLAAHKIFFARRAGGKQIRNLIDVIKEVKPTALIGLAATANLFDEPVCKEMAKHNARPIIFPLSNPVSLAECTFQDAIRWTDGKVLFASGSPFSTCGWRGITHEPGQGNNMCVRSSRLSQREADPFSLSVASQVRLPRYRSRRDSRRRHQGHGRHDRGCGPRFGRRPQPRGSRSRSPLPPFASVSRSSSPHQTHAYPILLTLDASASIREISACVAARVVRQAQKEKVDRNDLIKGMSEEQLAEYIFQKQYWPAYTINQNASY